MSLKIYSITECEEWDRIVRSFSDYDVYWLSGYVKAFMIHGDGIPLLFYYDDGSVRGINVVFKRDIADCDVFKDKIHRDEYFDLTTPYGYGGWLIEGNQSDCIFEEYEEYCNANNIISEFVRFHPVLGNSSFSSSFYDIIELGKTITMDLSSPDVVWENLSSKNRNMIRKAQKNGVCIMNGRSQELFDKFIDIYNETMAKDNAKTYYYFKSDFYKSVLNDLPYNSQIFYAELNNQIIASSIILTTNGMMNYHLSGSKREFSNLAPTNLLLYHAALWGAYNGYKSFYLGGGVGSAEDSLFKFKRAFYRKDDLHSFFIGKKIFMKEKYEWLVSLRNNVTDDAFFPKYRA
ncbi:lipid II:glycine glycyltransferase FemX [Ruminococcus flavefaciens]|uniref:lipid II:glycine glycyltransferase FemX n=1 Tax=Ruminococcus flavefaciens TaxID=1265 RepID=UPI000562EB50|nr:GNAT family N-acetyltransferase [Ruminococcus flavefaciens]